MAESVDKKGHRLTQSEQFNSFPWCEPCRSYHHPHNPTCEKLSRGERMLFDAALLIEEYCRTSLNTNRKTCECCSRTVFEDFPQAQVELELTAMAKRLRNIPVRLSPKSKETQKR